MKIENTRYITIVLRHSLAHNVYFNVHVVVFQTVIGDMVNLAHHKD